jgi:hypothetical protein
MDRVLLRAAVAFIWLATGLGVLHPYYREVGTHYLSPLGLGAWAMVAACALEVALALLVIAVPARPWLTALQVLMIVGFTLVLGVQEPALLVSPFGVLSKNVTLVCLILSLYWREWEGRSARAVWIIRLGLAFIWTWEGVMACVLFQGDTLREIITAAGLDFGRPSLVLQVMGVGQALAGLSLLVLRGRLLQLVLASQALGLLVICVLVTRYDAMLWMHPFGPLTKNVPLLLGTLVALGDVATSPARGNVRVTR